MHMEQNKTPISPNDFNVLVVDDNIKNIQLVGSILSNEGYNVEYTLDGKSALNWLETEKTDIVLLDIMMPEMSGFQVCEAIKSNEDLKDIPIIFISANTDHESLIKGFDAGGVDYVTKPFNAQELIKRVWTHIELQWRKNELQRVNTEKDIFYSIVAHDIKNPFTSVLTSFELIEQLFEGLSKDNIKEKLSRIKDDIELIVASSTNLLNWANHQTKYSKCLPEQLNITDIIDDEICLLNPTIIVKNITIIKEFDNCPPVFFDKTHLSMVIRNLLSNAIKYSHPNGKVSIKTKHTSESIELSIEDTGIGMPDNIVDNLFALSKKTTRPGTQNERGTGLGLLLINKLIEENNCELNIQSKPNKGTTATVVIPSPPH